MSILHHESAYRRATRATPFKTDSFILRENNNTISEINFAKI